MLENLPRGRLFALAVYLNATSTPNQKNRVRTHKKNGATACTGHAKTFLRRSSTLREDLAIKAVLVCCDPKLVCLMPRFLRYRV